MKTFYGLGKKHPTGLVRFFKGKEYKPDEDGDYQDEVGNYWSLRGMMKNADRGLISDKPRMEENE